MNRLLWWILGKLSMMRLKIRGVAISGKTYVIRKAFRIIGNAKKIEIDGTYPGGVYWT